MPCICTLYNTDVYREREGERERDPLPPTCVEVLVDRVPPFRTRPPEYCLGTGNKSVGGPDTG